MDKEELEYIKREMSKSPRFTIVPEWLAMNIWRHNPRVTIGLATSKEYELSEEALQDKFIMEAN